ncbi:MAG: nitroreductase family protein [Dehalococcoidales bacterium]|nr:nitroreductase family protein [Dehalococcoidales bacterium]
MDIFEAIRTRRSIRSYKMDTVDDGVLEQVLEAARWSPSWANTQCWRFIVVRNSDVKNELAATLTPTNPSINAIKTAPVVIVACAELKKAGYYRGEPTTVRGDWFMFDIGLAMANLTLAAHALGLGTVHVGNFDHKKAESILEVPEGFCVVEMTPLGYPGGEARTPPRKELTEIVSKEKFGAK